MRQGCVRLAEHGVQVGAVRRPANGAQEEGGGVGLPRPDVVLSLAHLPTRSARLRLLSACLPRVGREEQRRAAGSGSRLQGHRLYLEVQALLP